MDIKNKQEIEMEFELALANLELKGDSNVYVSQNYDIKKLSKRQPIQNIIKAEVVYRKKKKLTFNLHTVGRMFKVTLLINNDKVTLLKIKEHNFPNWREEELVLAALEVIKTVDFLRAWGPTN